MSLHAHPPAVAAHGERGRLHKLSVQDLRVVGKSWGTLAGPRAEAATRHRGTCYATRCPRLGPPLRTIFWVPRVTTDMFVWARCMGCLRRVNALGTGAVSTTPLE